MISTRERRKAAQEHLASQRAIAAQHMDHCPYCDWRYDPFAEPWVVYPIGETVVPIVFDDALHVARMTDAPNGYYMAAGWHICTEHTYEPEVLLLGPWEERLYGARPYWTRARSAS